MEISSFHQFSDESLSKALDHFYGLLRKTPTHGYNEPMQLNISTDGLRPQSKQLLDAFVGKNQDEGTRGGNEADREHGGQ